MFPTYHARETKARRNRDGIPKEEILSKKQAMGCGENKLMAQQVQETVHKI